jgi:hypothetical protein
MKCYFCEKIAVKHSNNLDLKKYKVAILIIFGSCILNFSSYAQSSYSINFGVLTGKNGNYLSDTINGFELKNFRNGYNLEAKAHFGTFSIFISPSVSYQSYTVSNTYNEINPFVKNSSVKSLKAKGTIGFQAGLLKKKMILRAGSGLNYNYIIMIDKNDQGVNFQTLRDNYLAYNMDFELDFYFLRLGLAYEKSFSKILQETDKLDFLIFSVGIRF